MKLYLAPIMGVTDRIYRDCFARHFSGIDCAVAPFVSSVSSRKLKPNYLKDLFPDGNRLLPVTPQILSNNADDFLFVAEKIGELGYSEINWNLGCPTPMIAKKKRGSGLLPHPDCIEPMLEKICTHWPQGISIKTRLGRVSTDELYTLLRIFDQYPLKELIIHPRLGVQMYSGQVDLTAFARCLALTRHPVVYNGDITDQTFLEECKIQFPTVRSWMIGRGLIANPFLAASCISGPANQLNSSSCRKILVSFHNELFSRNEAVLFGPAHLLGKMKAVWKFLGLIFADFHDVLKKINKCNTLARYKDVVQFVFESKEFAASLAIPG